MFRPSLGYTAAHQLAMTQTYQGHHHGHRGGLDFYTLARGAERSYSCSFLVILKNENEFYLCQLNCSLFKVNLDPDLLSLCSREDASTLDLARDALISHTRWRRLFGLVFLKKILFRT